jgi:hypothetical protein
LTGRKKAHSGLATTFRVDEVSAVNQFFQKLLAGGDVRVLAKSASLISVAGKFQRLGAKALRTDKASEHE